MALAGRPAELAPRNDGCEIGADGLKSEPQSPRGLVLGVPLAPLITGSHGSVAQSRDCARPFGNLRPITGNNVSGGIVWRQVLRVSGGPGLSVGRGSLREDSRRQPPPLSLERHPDGSVRQDGPALGEFGKQVDSVPRFL